MTPLCPATFIDGSMDEAVDGMAKERNIIFNSFALGLAGNLCTVMVTCFIVMEPPLSILAMIIVVYTGIRNNILAIFFVYI